MFGIKETGEIINALEQGNLLDRSYTSNIIRSLTCSSREDWNRFDLAFRKYWFPEEVRIDELDVIARIDPRARNTQRLSGFAGASEQSPPDDADSQVEGPGAGLGRSISKADFRFINNKQAMRQAEQLAERLANRLKRRLGRRRSYRTRGTQLDIRRTVRKSLASGGMPIKPSFAVRQENFPQLVVLHDVSHSMSWNNPLLFRFARGLVRAFPHSDAFAFHTKLFPVSSIYREQSLDRMRLRLEENNKLWMGGTRIAASLKTFNEEWSRQTLTPKTIVIVISDGFDTEEPEMLRDQVKAVSEKCRAVLWLNPMLGRHGVKLSVEDLERVLPEVDRFLPANSVDGLRLTVNRIAAINGL